MARIAVCLSGCGHMDGSEIQEATFTLLAVDQAGLDVLCCAPNIEQGDVVDHTTGGTARGETRNALSEAARIARGSIVNLATVSAQAVDALILPGGFGAAKTLSNYASAGADCTVHPQLERLIGEMLDAHKPIGAICISPVVLGRALANRHLKARLTIGTDSATAAAIESMGHTHCTTPPGGCIVDESLKIVTTPAYMHDCNPAAIYEGIRHLVDAVVKLVETSD